MTRAEVTGSNLGPQAPARTRGAAVSELPLEPWKSGMQRGREATRAAWHQPGDEHGADAGEPHSLTPPDGRTQPRGLRLPSFESLLLGESDGTQFPPRTPAPRDPEDTQGRSTPWKAGGLEDAQARPQSLPTTAYSPTVAETKSGNHVNVLRRARGHHHRYLSLPVPPKCICPAGKQTHLSRKKARRGRLSGSVG